MYIAFSRERLISSIEQDILSWSRVGGGPNMDAFDFDPVTQDPEELKQLGYYDNPSAWMAGVQIKHLSELLQEIKAAEEARIIRRI